jgi:hypothetical protein
MDILYYHFDITPEHIQDFVSVTDLKTCSKQYLKQYNGETTIHFKPIIKLFHVFSSIYYFFRIVETAPPPPPPKPILKIGGSISGTTKKVRIFCGDEAPKAPDTSERKKRIQIAYKSVGRKTRKHHNK